MITRWIIDVDAELAYQNSYAWRLHEKSPCI